MVHMIKQEEKSSVPVILTPLQPVSRWESWLLKMTKRKWSMIVFKITV